MPAAQLCSDHEIPGGAALVQPVMLAVVSVIRDSLHRTWFAR
jgi:hypothetical protein